MDVDPCKICGQGAEGGEALLQCCEVTCTMVAHPGCLPARAKQGARSSLRDWRCPGCWAKREAALRQKTQSKASVGLVKREGGRLKEEAAMKAEGGSKPAPGAVSVRLQKAETEVCKERQGKKRVQKLDSDAPPGRSKRVKGLADLYPSIDPDTVCSVCSSPYREDCMLLCETRGCQGTSHTFCCTPPLKAVPEGSWFCAQCTLKRGSVKVEKEKGFGSGSKRASRQGKDAGQRRKCGVAMPAVKGRQEQEAPLVVLDGANSDSGPSVHPDAECDICHNPERGDVMLLCNGPECESKQHTFCCIPPLEGVPGGDWFCPECAGERGGEVKGLVDDGVHCLFHHKGRRGKILNQCGNARAKGQRTCQFHVEYLRAAAEKAAKKKGSRTPEDLKSVTDCSGVEKPGWRTRGLLCKLESHGREQMEREDSPSGASSVHPDAECDACGCPENDDVMLLCSTHGCEGRQHTFCCRPKLKGVPSGDWFCPACKETKGGRKGGATQKGVFAPVAQRVRDGVRCSAISGGGGPMRQCVAARQEGYLRCAYHREQKTRQKERDRKRKAEGIPVPEQSSQGGGGWEVGKEPDTKKKEGAGKGVGRITTQKQGAKGTVGEWGGARKKVAKTGVLSGKGRDGGGFGRRAKALKEGAQGAELPRRRADTRQGATVPAATGESGEAEDPSATSLLRKRGARTSGENHGPLDGSCRSPEPKSKAPRLSTTPSEVGSPFDPVKLFLLEEAAVEDLTAPGLASPNQGLASAHRGLASATTPSGECALQGGDIAQSEKPEQGLRKDPPIRAAFAGEQLSWQTCETTLLMELDRAAGEGGTAGQAGKRAPFREAAERMQSADAEKRAGLENSEGRAPLEEAGERSGDAGKMTPLGEAEASMLLRDAGQALLRKIVAEEVQRLLGLQPQPAETLRLAAKQSAGEGGRLLGQFETPETRKEASQEENVHSNEEALEERSDEKRPTGDPSCKHAEQERASPSWTELISGGQSELEQISVIFEQNGPAGAAHASGGMAETSGTSEGPVGGQLARAGGSIYEERLEAATRGEDQAADRPEKRSGGGDMGRRDALEATDQAPGAPLPFPSTQHTAPEGRSYHINNTTTQVVRENEAPPAPPASGASPRTEHTALDGRSYDVNKTTRQVVREKPVELLTLEEKREPSHFDNGFTDNGRNYYLNRSTEALAQTNPEELKAAREEPVATLGVTMAGPSTLPAFRPPPYPSPSPPLQNAPFGDSSPMPPVAAVPALASSAAMLPTVEQAGIEAADGRPSAEGWRTEPVVKVQLSRAVGPHPHPVRLLHSPEDAAPLFEQPGPPLPSKPPTQERPLSRKPNPRSLPQNPGSRESSDPDDSNPSQPSDTCEKCTGSRKQNPQPTTSPPPFLEALRLEPESFAEGGRLAACTNSEVSPPYAVTARVAGGKSGSESKEVSHASHARPRPKADWSQLFKKPKLNLHSSR